MAKAKRFKANKKGGSGIQVDLRTGSNSLRDLSIGLTPAKGDITQEDASGMSTKDLSIGLANQYRRKTGGGAPTVMTNANKIERVVPLLNSKADRLSKSNLSANTGGGANFSNTGDSTGSSGGDGGSTFEDATNTGLGNKKKKKKEDEITYSPIEQQQLALLKQMQNTQDRKLRQSIYSTEATFNQREQQLRDSNSAALNTIKQVLNLGGSDRYAPVSSAGIISAQESAGIKALSELDALEQKTIGEIEAAREALDYQALEKKFDFLDKLRVEKQTKTDELEQTVKEEEDLRVKDTAMAELISKGITDPVEMFQALNTGGDLNVSFNDITTALKSIDEIRGTQVAGSGFKLDNKAVGLLLGNGWTSPDIKAMQADLASGASLDEVLAGVDSEMQDAVKQAFGIDETKGTNVIPGKGAKTSLEENIIRTRLFSKIAPILNKGTLSDADREIIDSRITEFRDAGMGEQEILDTLAGLPTEVTSPYNSKFRDLIVANSETIEKQNGNMGKLAQQLSNGNYLSAMNTVENLALNEAKKQDPDGYISTATTQNYLKKGKELATLVADAEDIIGPLDGTWEQVKSKLGKSKDNKAANISAKIAALVAQMRNDLSGTAVTSSEAAFLEPLIPSLSDTMLNFNTKIKALDENVLGQYNTVRSSVSLPEVNRDQVIDPKKRLGLYSNDIYLPKNGQLDL